MTRLLSLATLLLAVFSTPAFAQVETYEFDKAHTQIVFSVDHLGFSKSYGKFLDFDGEIVFDRSHPEKSSVNVTIPVKGLQMSTTEWVDHLMGDNFFKVATFPAMTFKSTGIKVTGENTADITGDLTVLGVTKPVVLKTIHNKSGNNPFSNKMQAGFSATTTLKRSDFGMTYGLPNVGDDIPVIIEVEAVRKDDTEQ